MPHHRRARRLAQAGAIFLLLAVGLGPVSLSAQDAERPERQPAAAGQRLPADAVTRHTVEVAGRSLAFTATAGSVPLTNAQGRVTAEMAYVAYVLDGVEPRQRPVTFAFNGGPGSASTWLHLGSLGPWRLRMDEAAIAPSAPPVLVANAETWLDFTDLVFIDPVGTGYSQLLAGDRQSGDAERDKRPPGDGAADSRRYFWSVSGDVESISDLIQKWLQKSGRLASPKMLVGESYGGFRGPRLARKLQERHGIGLNALVLVSPVLDFAGRRGTPSPLTYVSFLPSLAAAHLERQGQAIGRERLAPIEDYARVEYLNDLMRGPRDAAAVDRIVTRVADLTGLPDTVVRRLGGRIDGRTYNRETNRPEGKVASLYDASVKGLSPDPTSPHAREPDPFTTALSAPLTSAMVDLYGTRLGWRVDRRYFHSNGEVNRNWVWGNSPSPPESVSDLKEALGLDRRLRVMVVHGYTDLVTPYFATQLVLDQLPSYGDAQRISLVVYPGGHMFYSRELSRKAFREDALNLTERIIVESGAVEFGQ